jgi:hypothetical protein
MNIINTLLFRRQPLVNNILEELDLAQRSLLASQSAVEWAQSQVDYNRKRIDRLKAQKNELELMQPGLQSRPDQLPVSATL